MKYNCVFDDDVADAAKAAADANFRSVRQQIILYVTQGLQRDGYLPAQEVRKEKASSLAKAHEAFADAPLANIGKQL